MYPCNCCNFFKKNLFRCFCFWVCNSAFTHWLLCRPWLALAFHFWHHHFWPKLASSNVTQLLQVEKIFPIIPRYAQKVEWKTRSKIYCHYRWLLHGKICSSQWRFLWSVLTASKPIRRPITAAKRKKKGKNCTTGPNWLCMALFLGGPDWGLTDRLTAIDGTLINTNIYRVLR